MQWACLGMIKVVSEVTEKLISAQEGRGCVVGGVSCYQGPSEVNQECLGEVIM